MGPALRRLLARPSTLSLLRAVLTENDIPPLLAVSRPCQRCWILQRVGDRRHSSLISRTREIVQDLAEAEEDGWKPDSTSLSRQTERPPRTSRAARGMSGHDDAWQGLLSNFEQLDFESNVSSNNPSEKRLVDELKHKDNFALWLHLLDFRQRLYGLDGVADIWDGIRKRGILLPIRGEEADKLWSAFVKLGVARRDVLEDMLTYSKNLYDQFGYRWSKLYTSIITRVLPTDPNAALDWHARLSQIQPPNHDELAAIAPTAVQTRESLAIFRKIYTSSEVRNLYETIIPLFYAKEMFEEAFRWQKELLQRGDSPKTTELVEPLMRHLVHSGQAGKFNRLRKTLHLNGIPMSPSTSMISERVPVMSRELMNEMHGEILNIKPKTISDEFCAKLLATTAFSIDSILSGLQLFGVRTIGPLALRQIIIREGTSQAVRERLASLVQMGYSLGNSVYSRLVQRVSDSDNERVLQELITTDQHPDAMEDWKLQERLLSQYIDAHDWKKFDLTLEVLRASSNLTPSETTWNLVARAHQKRRNIDAAIETIQEMCIRGIFVNQKTTQYLSWLILRPRHAGRNPISLPTDRDDVGLLINLFRTILKAGGIVAPQQWNEVLKRLGKAGRLDDLENISLWLINYYLPQVKFHRVSTKSDLYTLPKSHPLCDVFHPLMQRAILEWGFIQAFAVNKRRPSKQRAILPSKQFYPSNNDPPDWARGILMLCTLRRHGIPISSTAISEGFRHRILQLFGDHESKLKTNRLARQTNPYSLEEMTIISSQIWDAPLLLPVHVDTPELEYVKTRQDQIATESAGKAIPSETSIK